MNTLRKLEATPLSPDELKRMYKRATGSDLKVIMLNSVRPTDTINNIFNSGCIVVYIPVLSSYNGHFVSLFRNEKGIFFCDSYGNTPKDLLNIINAMGKVNDHNTLFKIILNSGIPCYYNNVDYQAHSDNISDCGRYSVLNCIWYTLNKRKNTYYDLNNFFSLLTTHKNNNNLQTYDDAVAFITKDL